MIIRRKPALTIIVVGSIVFGMLTIVTAHIVPGLSVFALAGLLPEWAISSKVGHSVAEFQGDVQSVNPAAFIEAIEQLARRHGLLRNGVDLPPLTTLQNHRLSYGSDKAYLEFYAAGAAGELAIGLEPGTDEVPTGLIADAGAVLASFGFKAR